MAYLGAVSMGACSRATMRARQLHAGHQSWADRAAKDTSGLTTEMFDLPLGGLLREWRRRRRMSQHDLACDANISARRLSFLEMGRSRPSRQMLLHLAACLDIPLRYRNDMLRAAGFATSFQERSFGEPAMTPIHRNVEVV